MDVFRVHGIDAILLIVFAFIFYKLAESEKASILLWVSLSIIVFLGARLLSLGMLGVIIGQLILFFGLMLIKVLSSKKK
jgi:predicted branched-subunit amino acid permease